MLIHFYLTVRHESQPVVAVGQIERCYPVLRALQSLSGYSSNFNCLAKVQANPLVDVVVFCGPGSMIMKPRTKAGILSAVF